ncbi:MAG TPA: tetratricopeptide repeat protein [Vicinamibacterales bacterium]
MGSVQNIEELAAAALRRRTLIVILLLVVLVSVTGFVAQAYHRAKSDRAAEQFTLARDLLERQQPEAALGPLRTAVALMPGELPYRRALAFALSAANHHDEARSHLSSLLAIDPVDGEANLLMARLERDSPEVAERYYQRAIYGRWPADPAERRLDVRFELVDLLASRGETTKVKAELLRLAAEVPDEPSRLHQLAVRYLRVGEAENALELYRRLVKHDPEDARARAGQAEAAFLARRFAEARVAASTAVDLNPDDEASRRRLEIATRVVQLDPLAARLSARERARRAAILLDRAVSELERCAGAGAPPAVMPEVSSTVTAAREQLEEAGARPPASAMDSLVAAAEEAWRLRPSVCGRDAPPPPAELTYVFEKLQQSRDTAER